MSGFASVALFNRAGVGPIFKPPRKERPEELTQARKAAARHWRAQSNDTDALVKVFVARLRGGRFEVSERRYDATDWIVFNRTLDSVKEPHLKAVMTELGIDAMDVPPPVPDVLEINGAIYRRDI